MTRAIYAGSFDPLTNGHVWMIKEALRLFDDLTVVVGVNPSKKPMFTPHERGVMIWGALAGHNTDNMSFDTMGNEFLVHYARQVLATHLVRGVRSAADFDYEFTMRQINSDIEPSITTVVLMPPRELADVSSSMVKGLIGVEGWANVAQSYVPNCVLDALKEKFPWQS